MKTLKNEDGIALVTALLLTLIALAIILAALYFITQQTKLSAAHKRYRTSLEASHGGAEIFTKEIIPMVFNGYSSSAITQAFTDINLTQNISNPCFVMKLTENTARWPDACKDTVKPFDPKSKPDYQFQLRGVGTLPGFNVYTKLVDTQAGNSDTSGYELLDSASAVTSSTSSVVAPKHIPAVYRVEVQGESAKNPQEKAALTVLYAY